MYKSYWAKLVSRKSSVAIVTIQLIAALSAIGVLVAPSQGHEIRPSIVDIAPDDGEIIVTFEGNLEALLSGIGADHEDTDEAPQAVQYNKLRALTPEALEKEFEPRAGSFAANLTLLAGDALIALMPSEVKIPDQPDIDLARDSIVVFRGSFTGNETLTWSLPEVFGESILRVRDKTGEITHTDFLTPGMTSSAFQMDGGEPQSWLSVFLNYIAVGFDHIVPKGLDHIVFVIGLFLFSPKIGPLLAQVTAFTLAHTITLALGSLGILSITPWIVESIIALSIVYVGLENIILRDFQRHRIALVFGFGLLHGLGFAGVLGDFGLPEAAFVPALIGFNIGVEFGQLAVIAACLVLTFLIRNQSWYRSAITVPASVLVALVGAYWVLERIGFLPESLSGLI